MAAGTTAIATINRNWLELKHKWDAQPGELFTSINRNWLELKPDGRTQTRNRRGPINRNWLELKPVPPGGSGGAPAAH